MSYLVGVLTLWPIFYLGLLLGVILVLVATGGPAGGSEPLPGILATFVLHLLTILLVIGLLVLYLVDVLRDERLKEQPKRRTQWVVLNVLVKPFAWPFYWWIFLRPGSEEFRARVHAA